MRVNAPRQVKSDLRSVEENRSTKRPGGWIPMHETTAGKVLIGIVCVAVIGGLIASVAIPFIYAAVTTSGSETSTSATTTAPICTPFWSMPASDQGTSLTYINANTQISGSVSRSGCALVRASSINADNLVFSIGSHRTTPSTPSGCNEHFALSIISSSSVTVYGMCGTYDNGNIGLGQSILYDGNFHQLCVTYDSSNLQLCVYLDLYSPTCLIRSNPLYNTGSGDVRIGWWPDGNRGFISSGGGLIKSVALFNTAVNQTCVTYQYQNNFAG